MLDTSVCICQIAVLSKNKTIFVSEELMALKTKLVQSSAIGLDFWLTEEIFLELSQSAP
jgi:hypothetical protein